MSQNEKFHFEGSPFHLQRRKGAVKREMRRKKKVWLSGFCGGVGISILLGSGVFYLQYQALPLVGDSVVTGEEAQKAAEIEHLIKDNYLEEVDTETLADGMYAGMVYALGDRYSGYYSEEYYEKLKESLEGKYTGIGLSMSQNTETKIVTVEECFEGSPADKAGVKAGDIIQKINGNDTKEMTVSEIADQIKHENKEIQLTLLREEEEITLTITPETVEVPVVRSRMLEEKKGYVQIEEFTEGTSEQFARAYQELLEQDAEGLIIDLRNNPGGLLDAVCDTLEQILPEGLIVYTEDRHGNREEHYCAGETPMEIPLVVLINENSASAAEIFAGAVKDHEIATLVGTTTFGKGIVQKTYALDDGSAVKLTTSKYYTPNGVNIHGTGIEPDIKVEWPKDEGELENPKEYNQLEWKAWKKADPQMKKSMEVLETVVAGGEK